MEEGIRKAFFLSERYQIWSHNENIEYNKSLDLFETESFDRYDTATCQKLNNIYDGFEDGYIFHEQENKKLREVLEEWVEVATWNQTVYDCPHCGKKTVTGFLCIQCGKDPYDKVEALSQTKEAQDE